MTANDFNLILGSDLAAGAYHIKINENGSMIEQSTGQGLCQISPWPFADSQDFLEQIEELSQRLTNIEQERDLLLSEMEDEDDTEFDEDEDEDEDELSVFGKLKEALIGDEEPEVPDEEEVDGAGTPEDTTGGGSGIGEDDVSGHGEQPSGDESSPTPGPEGEHDSAPEE